MVCDKCGAGDLTSGEATAILRGAGMSEADVAASYEQLTSKMDTLSRVMSERDAALKRIASLEAQVAYEREERIAAGAWCEQAKIAEERVAALVEALREIDAATETGCTCGRRGRNYSRYACALCAALTKAHVSLHDLPAAAEAYRQRVRREALEEAAQVAASAYDRNMTASQAGGPQHRLRAEERALAAAGIEDEIRALAAKREGK